MIFAEPRLRRAVTNFEAFFPVAAIITVHHALASPSAARSSSAQRPQVAAKLTQFVCRAHQKQAAVQEDDAGLLSRRLALTVLIGAAAVATKVSPADAAYGAAANVFGKPKTNTDFLPYNGDGFKLNIPSKWNPSKEVEFGVSTWSTSLEQRKL
ncbi:hypothetical protein K1719_012503 [Acacia pycnantha]|nr:hypothetical protein K1719_012503 [Acacia pycnantha]